jgi:hypothetical protein
MMMALESAYSPIMEDMSQEVLDVRLSGGESSVFEHDLQTLYRDDDKRRDDYAVKSPLGTNKC